MSDTTNTTENMEQVTEQAKGNAGSTGKRRGQF